jgi:glutathione synthase/RimK-type ligase-like ATP-grasp enzyme
MIIKSNRELKTLYNELSSGDVFIGNLSLKHLKQSLLIDMLERGVLCLPSALSQILNSSKVAQAFILRDWMLPFTFVILRRADLIEAVNTFNAHHLGPAVTKQDSMHCGHGIRRWESIETLYSFMALSESAYPFVVQPFQEKFTDVRVICVGDYVEAYTRYNPNNFRVNLTLGGTGSPYQLNAEQQALCRCVMQRAKFPFAHLDLMILENGKCYLSEIALNGGIKGARIDRQDLDHRKQTLLEKLANKSA